MDLLEQVRRTVEDHGMLCHGDAVVVGVSGGADSVCLLHVLLHMCADHGLRLQIAHLNHGARGLESERDARFVAALSRSWGVDAVTERVDVPALARSRGLAFEEAARRVRYGFLARVAKTVGAAKIAVGHNADDQAETVLMHLVRGTGLAGLRGMLPVTPLRSLRYLGDCRAPGCAVEPSLQAGPGPTRLRCSVNDRLAIIRPLLDVPRERIEAYCAANQLEYRFDLSNLDCTYFRNRLRNELLPLLGTYNPRIRERLRHTAAIAAADYELLARQRDEAWQRVAAKDAPGQLVLINKKAWAALPVALQRATLRRGVRELRPGLRDVSYQHVENARQLALAGSPGTLATLPSHLILRVGYDTLTLGKIGMEEPLPDEPLIFHPEPVPVSVPGVTVMPGSPWRLVATILGEWDLATIRANEENWTAYFDRDQLRGPVALRTRTPGDAFEPQGMGGRSVKLGAFLINRKVPRHSRRHIPLLVASGRIVWVCGHRLAEGAGVGPATSQVVRLRFERVLRVDTAVVAPVVPRVPAPGDGNA